MKKLCKTLTHSLSEVAAVYMSELRIMKSDVGLLIFLLFLPLVYPPIYSLIYNPEVVRNINVVVIDHDRTDLSRELVRKFNATPAARVIGYATDLPDARKAVNQGDAFAILEIPDGFAADLNKGRQATPVLFCDMSLLLRYRELLVASTGVALDMGAELQQRTLAEAGVGSIVAADAEFPMEASYRPMGNISSGFDSFVMPGVLMLVLHQCIVLIIAMRGGATMESPRHCGYFPLNYTRSTLLTMLGQSLCYFTLLFLPLIWLVYFVPLIFHFPMMGDIVQILLFLFPYMLATMMLGYVVQAFITERESVFLVWVITSVVLLFLSGLTWPTFAMHFPWNLLSDILPSSWGVQGYIRMLSDGASLSDVAADYRNLWLLTLLWGFIAYLIQRWVVRPRARMALVTRLRVAESLRSSSSPLI